MAMPSGHKVVRMNRSTSGGKPGSSTWNDLTWEQDVLARASVRSSMQQLPNSRRGCAPGSFLIARMRAETSVSATGCFMPIR